MRLIYSLIRLLMRVSCRFWKILRQKLFHKRVPWSARIPCISRQPARRLQFRMARREARKLFIRWLRQWFSLVLRFWSRYSSHIGITWKTALLLKVTAKLELARKTPWNNCQTMITATSRKGSIRWSSSTLETPPQSSQTSTRQARQ